MIQPTHWVVRPSLLIYFIPSGRGHRLVRHACSQRGNQAYNLIKNCPFDPTNKKGWIPLLWNLPPNLCESVAAGKGTWAVKLHANKILQFMADGAS